MTLAAADEKCDDEPGFASPEVQERGGNVTESSISFKPFDAWTPQSDWSMSLDKGEEAQVHMCKTLPLLIWFV